MLREYKNSSYCYNKCISYKFHPQSRTVIMSLAKPSQPIIQLDKKERESLKRAFLVEINKLKTQKYSYFRNSKFVYTFCTFLVRNSEFRADSKIGFVGIRDRMCVL